MRLVFQEAFNKLLPKKIFMIVAGLHGDEPAGNVVAQYYKNKANVYVISGINNTKKRRYNGKDLNRHFDTKDETEIQDSILSAIEKVKPDLVICLHEDDEVDGMYVYCSPVLTNFLKKGLKNINIDIAKKAHQDKTDKGIINNGEQPYKGTLERALKRRDILHCTIETPSANYPEEDRVQNMKALVDYIIDNYN